MKVIKSQPYTIINENENEGTIFLKSSGQPKSRPTIERINAKDKHLLDHTWTFCHSVLAWHAGVGTKGSALNEDGVLDIDTTISLESWIGIRFILYYLFLYQHSVKIFNLNIVAHWLSICITCSNYDVFLTRDCLPYSKVKPALNQIETHPYFQRDSLVKFCKKHGIYVTAHTPLGGAIANIKRFGSISCLDDPVLKVTN